MGPRGAMAPLANENLHCMNSKTATVHYCSKMMAPLILLKLEVKLRQCIISLLIPSDTHTEYTEKNYFQLPAKLKHMVI